jgi:flagellar protein FlbT
MPLKLSLKPGETFIVNGAVVRNGERRGVLLLETQARILREKDILQPADATTPAGRACFCIMQMYLVGAEAGPLYDQAADALAGWMAEPGADRVEVLGISADLTAGDYYRALSRCRKLMAKPGSEAA